jgi:hypothetical protein
MAAELTRLPHKIAIHLQFSLQAASLETFGYTHVWGRVGPTAGLDTVAKRNNPCPRQESNLRCQARSLVTMPKRR